jgi:monoamine oxidase
VSVTTKTGKTLEGDYIVLAMPPCSHSKIMFKPMLPQQKRFISQHNFMGSIMKVLVLYKKNFWKDKGFTGEVVSDCVDSPAFNIFDDSRPNEESGEMQPALVVFLNGAVQRSWESRPDLISKILAKIKIYFDSEEALNPMHIEVQNWGQEYGIYGGPVANFPPGVLSQLTEEIGTPVGRIYFAGTEYATESQGFMDGAIQSGKLVTEKLLNTMKLKLSKEDEKSTFSEVFVKNKCDVGFEDFPSFYDNGEGKFKINSNYRMKGNAKRGWREYDRYWGKKCEFNTKFFMLITLIFLICWGVSKVFL